MKIGFKLWLLIIALVLSLIAIRPSFGSDGVLVTSLEQESLLKEQGMTTGEIIKSINGKPVEDKESYAMIVQDLFADGKEKRADVVTDKGEYTLLTNETFKITVENVPRSRIQTGLDLRGGARAVVQPDVAVTDAQLNDLVEVSRNRLNVYGLSDVNIRGASDLSGEKFLIIEIAGATPADIENLIGQQGKFEAKIGNTTVFVGGTERDIRDVCRNDATCAAVTSCGPGPDGGNFCNFAFTLYLSEEAAERHAEITRNLTLDKTGQYLSKPLSLLVDDKEVESLLISSGLRGQTTTQISIQGAGAGATQEEALKNARTEMRKLQTVLLTGSLPYKLNIVRLDTISPTLGKEFTYAIILAGICSILAVSLIIFVRYRKLKASLALLLTAFSEIVIILGVAAFIGWNLDLPSIAGILATIGTGVDQQIIIMDEASRNRTASIKQRMKQALFVIVSAYMTSVVSLLPLYKAGAGLFKGFALTTIIGITAGVLITRPAFAEMIKKMEE